MLLKVGFGSLSLQQQQEEEQQQQLRQFLDLLSQVKIDFDTLLETGVLLNLKLHQISNMSVVQVIIGFAQTLQGFWPSRGRRIN